MQLAIHLEIMIANMQNGASENSHIMSTSESKSVLINIDFSLAMNISIQSLIKIKFNLWL